MKKTMPFRATNRWKRVTAKNLDAFLERCEFTRGGGWLIAPEDQGQIVEVSYAFAFMDEDWILVRRTLDRSDRSIELAFRMARSSDEPWNTSPR